MKCEEALFGHLNSCVQLKTHFPCEECAVSFGPDQPCYVSPDAPSINVSLVLVVVACALGSSWVVCTRGGFYGSYVLACMGAVIVLRKNSQATASQATAGDVILFWGYYFCAVLFCPKHFRFHFTKNVALWWAVFVVSILQRAMKPRRVYFSTALDNTGVYYRATPH